jgi:hypothetical protein
MQIYAFEKTLLLLRKINYAWSGLTIYLHLLFFFTRINFFVQRQAGIKHVLNEREQCITISIRIWLQSSWKIDTYTHTHIRNKVAKLLAFQLIFEGWKYWTHFKNSTTAIFISHSKENHNFWLFLSR